MCRQMLTHTGVHLRVLAVAMCRVHPHIGCTYRRQRRSTPYRGFQSVAPRLRAFSALCSDLLASLLYLPGNDQQRFELVGDGRLEEVTLDLVDQP